MSSVTEKVVVYKSKDSVHFVPMIGSVGSDKESNDTADARKFESDDMPRVLDFSGLPDAPADGPMGHCEESSSGPQFRTRHVCLRGAFLFYFNEEDVDDESARIVTYKAPPLGVVALAGCVVDFPPGGRRVFREHADTEARNGYEMVIAHRPDDEKPQRPHAFLVAESLGQREKWATAIRLRAEIRDKDTVLRPGPKKAPTRESGKPSKGTRRSSDKTDRRTSKGKSSDSPSLPPERRSSIGSRGSDSMDETGTWTEKEKEEEKKELNRALNEFGSATFSPSEWVDKFFIKQNDFDAPSQCRQMEQWQSSIRKGVKGAVLEQYRYFVEASGEMTTMGREIATLKALVESQSECIREMKDLDFTANSRDPVTDEALAGYSSDEEDANPRIHAVNDDDSSVASSVSEWSGPGGRTRGKKKGRSSRKDKPSLISLGETTLDRNGLLIEIPPYLEDVTEEIAVMVRFCRYTDATELTIKAKAEVTDILSQHEKLTDRKLSKKQLAFTQRILDTINQLSERMCSRISETLRRKNEALKAAAKRDRSDPLSAMSPLVSPTCLNDDIAYLQLLVKLGRTQDAASAYAARRSLLLMETLFERPIAGVGSTGTNDVVIYAAQLSQGFFSCLANAVEGFLDLFTLADATAGGSRDKDEDSVTEDSSIQTGGGRNVPAGALSAVVLWCDTELLKFSNSFGGSRVLGSLALSPPGQRYDFSKKSEKGETTAQLRQQMTGDKMKQKGGSVIAECSNDNKERTAAIEVASKCVDQAFQFASENLDSIGLPLTPRLAEYMRDKLKGCESEIAKLFEGRWDHITFDWVEEEPMAQVEEATYRSSRRRREKKETSSDAPDDELRSKLSRER